MVDIGLLHIPVSARQSALLAQRAELRGLRWLGVADSPQIFGALYPTIQHVLANTSAIRVGPLVTNPVTRHWSVHASTLAAFEELFPGRTFLGISAGDSAVHSVGLRPGDAAQVARTVEAVRDAVGPRMPIITAVGGPKAAAAVSPASDAVLLGSGLEVRALADLARRANAAPFGTRSTWLYAVCNLVDDADDIPESRRAVRAPVVSFSRHALSGSMSARHVPPELVDGLTDMYRRYDYDQHSRLGSANARLLDNAPREEDYLMGRFAIVDTPAGAARRIGALVDELGGDVGVFLSTAVPDPHAQIDRIATLTEHLSAGC